MSTVPPSATSRPLTAIINDIIEVREAIYDATGSALLAGERCNPQDKTTIYQRLCSANNTLWGAVEDLQAIDTPAANAPLNTPHPAPDASEPMVPNGNYREIQLGGSTVSETVDIESEPVPMFPQPEALLHFLKAAGQGCISGNVSEWPQLRPACRWAAEQLTAHSESDWRKAMQGLLNAMDMQMKRESEEFHIKQDVALGIWNDAIDAAKAALSAPSATPPKDRVEKALRSVFGSWHVCAMGTRRNPLHAEDEARGIKAGQLCDDCEGQIKAHLKEIFG